MKKLLVLLLALTMVGAAFAADPAMTFGMYGEFVATNFEDDGTTEYTEYAELYVNYKADDMGFSMTAISDGDHDFFKEPRNYSVYFNLFDGKAKLYAGVLRETGDVRLTSFIEGNGFSTRIANVDAGWMLKVMPIDGLVAAAFVPMTGADTGDDFGAASFGAGYTVTDMVKVVFSYKLDDEELAIGADLLMVEGLTARVGFKNAADVNYIYATAGYTMDALTFGLDAALTLDDPFEYGFEVQAEYGMDPFAFGVLASYGSDSAAWFSGGVALYPYATMTFSAGWLELGFQLNADETWSIPLLFGLDF